MQQDRPNDGSKLAIETVVVSSKIYGARKSEAGVAAPDVSSLSISLSRLFIENEAIMGRTREDCRLRILGIILYMAPDDGNDCWSSVLNLLLLTLFRSTLA